MRRCSRRSAAAVGLLAVLALGANARAQSSPGGVAESGMAQGQASITTRSDVTIALESVPGTSGARIAVLGRGVSARIAEVRRCYAQTIAERPSVHGRLRLRLDVPATGANTSTVVEDGVGDAPLLGCVRRVLSGVDLEASLRPASALVVLDFDNTAARGAAEVAAQQAQAEAVAVSRSSGRPEASGEGNGVRFTVRASPETSDEVVADAVRVLRSQIAGLLDCRRRAGRRGRNPAGTLSFEMVLRQGATPTVTAGPSTVADPLAPRCVVQSVARAHRRPTLEGRVDVEVRFDP